MLRGCGVSGTRHNNKSTNVPATLISTNPSQNLSSHVVVVARNWLVGEAEGKVWVNLRHQLKIKPQVILLH